MTSPDPLARCAECGCAFTVGPVAKCPACGGRQVRAVEGDLERDIRSGLAFARESLRLAIANLAEFPEYREECVESVRFWRESVRDWMRAEAAP